MIRSFRLVSLRENTETHEKSKFEIIATKRQRNYSTFIYTNIGFIS